MKIVSLANRNSFFIREFGFVYDTKENIREPQHYYCTKFTYFAFIDVDACHLKKN